MTPVIQGPQKTSAFPEEWSYIVSKYLTREMPTGFILSKVKPLLSTLLSVPKNNYNMDKFLAFRRSDKDRQSWREIVTLRKLLM